MDSRQIIAIGDRIRFCRKSLGLSQEQLAEKIQVAVNTISNFENGRYMISLDNIIRLSTFFNVSLDYLLLGKNSTSKGDEFIERYEKLPENEKEKLHKFMQIYYPE